MDEAEKVLEQVDGMHLEFAKRAAVSKFFRQIEAVPDQFNWKWTFFVYETVKIFWFYPQLAKRAAVSKF